MRKISFEKIADVVEQLCISAAHELSVDVVEALQKAAQQESNPKAAKILGQLIDNAELAKKDMIPLCQDTGLTVVFIEQGSDTFIEAQNGRTIIDAVNEGVKAGYEKGYLRKSVVAEPLNQRKNTGTNAPAIIHHFVVPGDKLKISIMLKGGGCENKSQFRMFKPTAEKDEIINWVLDVVKQAGPDACPPFVIGVGIGGDFEMSCLLSKKALLRNLEQKNSDNFYAAMEQELLSKINRLGIGPAGFGGGTTALGCMIEVSPCHIASLPVAVNIECHSHRHKSAVI